MSLFLNQVHHLPSENLQQIPASVFHKQKARRHREKKRKAEEKARKKRERELMELRKMLSTEIIEKGETQEGAVKHRFTNSLGDFQAAPGGN